MQQNIACPYLSCKCLEPPYNPTDDFGYIEQATEIWFGKMDRQYDRDYWPDCYASMACYKKFKPGEIQEAITEHAQVIYVPPSQAEFKLWELDKELENLLIANPATANELI